MAVISCYCRPSVRYGLVKFCFLVEMWVRMETTYISELRNWKNEDIVFPRLSAHPQFSASFE